MTNKSSVYIHIPFCLQKCHYCCFVSYTNNENYINSYINALVNEIEFNLQKSPVKKLATIYIGGGTPSIIPVEYYKRIIASLNKYTNISSDCEFTIEINPGTVDYQYLKTLRELGINRLSIGVQSFNNEILTIINRKHSSKQAIDAIKLAQKAGFDNVSIDLIYGLPRQTTEDWLNTLDIAVNQNIQHISAYGLKIEDGTYFGNNEPKNLPDDEKTSDMYLKTIHKLKSAGFEHYEISNFARLKMQSKHNMNYWENNEYFGFGIAAHGYINGIRYSNCIELNDYITNPLQKNNENYISQDEKLEEAIFLGMRMLKGIDLVKFQDKYNVDLITKHKATVDKYQDLKLLALKDNTLKLTTNGILLSNTVLADFLE